MNAAVCLTSILHVLLFAVVITNGKEMAKDEVDKVIEDEITQKLSEDLLQSIEKKFHVDLERSVDSVLLKIKLLLQNGTVHIQERLGELQDLVDTMKKDAESAVESCFAEKQQETTALAEKALHQMVVCGYALIGHDPAQAVRNVMDLKTMIKHGLKPIYEQRQEVYNLLKVCGHDHGSLKKVIKCVISKSPQLKTAMMGVSGKLIDGVINLTKQMAHGAMHEACLIEVIRNVEEEAFLIITKVRKCAYKNNTDVLEEIDRYIKEDNATVLDIKRVNMKLDNESPKDKEVEQAAKEEIDDEPEETKKVADMKNILRRMLKQSKTDETDLKYKSNLLKLHKEEGADQTNALNADNADVDK